MIVMLTAAACGAKTETSSNNESSGIAGTTPAPATIGRTPGSTSGSAAAPEGGSLLDKVASVGADAALEARFAGEASAVKSGLSPLVFFGRAGDQAFVYICDGTKATWYKGSVSTAGAGRLQATDSAASVDLSGGGDALEAK